jgi:hypothetical protein
VVEGARLESECAPWVPWVRIPPSPPRKLPTQAASACVLHIINSSLVSVPHSRLLFRMDKAKAKTLSPRNVFILRTALAVLIMLLLIVFHSCSMRRLTEQIETRKSLALFHLEGLQKSVREENAAQRMQALFPEGSCFTVTLYGLAWTNLSRSFPADKALRKRAAEEAMWCFRQYDLDYVSYPFTDTQVHNGVFWLGQKNILAGQLLDILPKDERPEEVVESFHKNSRQLADAFLASPTHHLDAYPAQSWPVDNVTALCSILIHDDLYGTDYAQVFEAWKKWMLANLASDTSLPPCKIDSRTGRPLEPARGCTNSWLVALLARHDPELARDWYEKYKEHFLIRRFGFAMFREYTEEFQAGGDVDSGPIIWGAGMTATGAGLAAANAVGDTPTANDIYDLTQMFGLPGTIDNNGTTGRRYLAGQLPVGDAFLTWGHSYVRPDLDPPVQQPRSFLERQLQRFSFHIILIIIYIVLIFIIWRGWRKYRKQDVGKPVVEKPASDSEAIKKQASE